LIGATVKELIVGVGPTVVVVSVETVVVVDVVVVFVSVVGLLQPALSASPMRRQKTPNLRIVMKRLF
jgi:hypothetical protein